MFSKKRLDSTSKFLSLVLRHRPEAIGLELDSEGWLELGMLISKAGEHGKELSTELIREVVATSEKQRFALSGDGLRIRANQGHSIAGVDLNLKPQQPPEELFHGTVAAFLGAIRSEGLHKRSRNHVHLSIDETTATQVGSRRGVPIVIRVASGKMHQQGHQFFQAANGVWLVEEVPVEFLTFPADETVPSG